MRFMPAIEALQKFAVGFLINSVCFLFIEPINSEISIFVSRWDDKAIEIASITVVHFCLMDGLISILN